MIFDILKENILQNIGSLRSAPKNWKKRNCPMCVSRGYGIDTRNRFGIRFENNVISCNCFNCAYSSSYTDGKDLSKSFKFFLQQIHIDEKFIEYLEFEIFKQRNNIILFRDGEDVENTEVKFKKLFNKWQPIDLPKDALTIEKWLECNLGESDFLKVADYLINRRLFDLDKFYWTPNKQHNLNQRVIIPYYYKNDIVGFTSRLCFDTKDKSIPKYYQQCPNDFVYNLDQQQDYANRYVLVTEGVLDAYVINGISVLGEVGQLKVDIINRLNKEVIVCPDRDKKGSDLVNIAIENNWKVSFPKWDIGIKDAAQAAEKYGRLLTICSIISSAEKDKIKIQLKWEILQNELERQRNY